jgi:hypothetical protein
MAWAFESPAEHWTHHDVRQMEYWRTRPASERLAQAASYRWRRDGAVANRPSGRGGSCLPTIRSVPSDEPPADRHLRALLRFMSLPDLIVNKRAAGREKDLADVKALEASSPDRS